ncbi:MAG TPA: hypothetical protein VGO21_04600 [Candidatus Paceibacterota bacterium]|nr:hypothetical protein [Candidatus Paceibacterota bacterium]
MNNEDSKSEINDLKHYLTEKEILLETFLKSKELFKKTQEIFQEMKGIKNSIESLRRLKD